MMSWSGADLGASARASCPGCGGESGRVHSRYERELRFVRCHVVVTGISQILIRRPTCTGPVWCSARWAPLVALGE